MTIQAHKFVAALLTPGLEYVDRQDNDINPEVLAGFADLINMAEKFDFGELVLEPGTEPNTFIPPTITDLERDIWLQGLIPLPAPMCWYEFSIAGRRSGMIVIMDEGRPKTTTLFFSHTDNSLQLAGHWVSICNDVANTSYGQFIFATAVGDLLSKGDRLQLVIQYEVMVYLTLMINSPTTEVHREQAPHRLNAARIKKGLAPLPPHRVVRIVPERYLREARAAAGLQRLPPRLHWRRSHIRILYRGQGNERKTIIPRCLVGIANDGEVSHEYRIGRGS
jgi:hypothetical protein